MPNSFGDRNRDALPCQAEPAEVKTDKDKTGNENVKYGVIWNPRFGNENSKESCDNCTDRGLPKLDMRNDSTEKVTGINAPDNERG